MGPTILVKLSLGKNPDIISMLNRLKVFDNNAQHIQNVSIKRGVKNMLQLLYFYSSNKKGETSSP